MKQHGLWDRKNKQWLGNGEKKNGPNVYGSEEIAKIAAQICAKMLNLPASQIIARAFGPEDQDLLWVGEEDATYTFNEVIEEVTKGKQQYGK